MKRTWPPPQVILVGLELNQHGHAASHEHASSSWPVIFHGVFSFDSLAARTGAAGMRSDATSAHGSTNGVFIALNATMTRGWWATSFQAGLPAVAWRFRRFASAKTTAHSLQPFVLRYVPSEGWSG